MIITKYTVLQVKDVMRIANVSQRTAQRILYRIRKDSNLPRLSFITVEQFALSSGMREKVIIDLLNGQ